MTDEQARKLAAISVVVIPKRIMGGLTMELTGATDAARCGGESDSKR